MTESLECRFAAAERTIAALKERVVALQGGTSSPIQRQLEAARRREDESRRRRAVMEVRTEELARYSSTLEAEVAARTLAMRRILNNVTFGFLIVDADLFVLPECTDSCARLLDAASVAGAQLPDLLRLEGREAATYRACVLQAFEDLMPEDVSLAQMRTSFRIGSRTIRAEARIVRGASGTVEGLLYTLSDISDLLAAQAESARNRMLVGILRNWESFVAFLEDARTLLVRADLALASGDAAAARRELHTVKGNAASFDMTEVVECIHQIEGSPLGADGVASARACLEAFLQKHGDVIGQSLGDSDQVTFPVSEDQLNAVVRIAGEVDSPALIGWVAEIVERPARVMLGPIEAFSSKLADRLGKAVDVTLAGAETPLDDRTMRAVMQTVVHLVRNAIDHGIEPADQRGSKPATGQVRVGVTRTAEAYGITVADDGAGIEVERVVARALESAAVGPAELDAMRAEDRLALIFRDGVSTARTVSNISGRGVGMSAVLSAVHRAGGSVAVESEEGRGTTIRLSVPRPRVSLPPRRRASAAPRVLAPTARGLQLEP